MLWVTPEWRLAPRTRSRLPSSLCPHFRAHYSLHEVGFTYFVVTHERYRKIASAEAKKEYFREEKQKQRTKNDSEKASCPRHVQDVSKTCQGHSVYVSASVSASGKEGESEGEKINWDEIQGRWNTLAKANGLKTVRKLTEQDRVKTPPRQY